MTSAQGFDIEPLARFGGSAPVSDGQRSVFLILIPMEIARTTVYHAQEISCFSYDDQHKYRWDDSSLRYYYPPVLPVDLSRGFEQFRSLDDTGDDHLDGLVNTIALYEKEKGARAEADVVTWRGMMTKVKRSEFRQD